MPLDDRRLAMLREMGVPFWQPLARTDAVEPAEPQQLPAAPSPEPSRALPPEALTAAARPVLRGAAPAPPPGPSAPSASADPAAPSAPAILFRWLRNGLRRLLRRPF